MIPREYLDMVFQMERVAEMENKEVQDNVTSPYGYHRTSHEMFTGERLAEEHGIFDGREARFE